MRQIHINTDDETKKMLEDSAKYLRLSLSSFIMFFSVQEARKILQQKRSENGKQT